MKLGLMVIDMQRAYYHGQSKTSMDGAAEYINEVLPWFRARNLPILWVQDADEEGGVVPGTEGFEIIENLVPALGEYRVTKTYGNSFNQTDCQKILKEQGVDTIVITGYSAEYCVLSTYRGAQDLDLTPVLLINGLASEYPERTRMVQDMSTTVSYGMLKKVMGY